MNYYYFAATLPLLSLDAPPPFGVEAFLALCAEHLRPADLEAVRAMHDGAAHPNGFLQAWRDKETQLRNALARTRAGRLGRDAAPFLRPVRDIDLAVEKAAADAYARPNPLERERALDRHRWDVAETLAGHNAFALEALLAYAVKLRLAERWAGMDETAGKQRAQALIAQQPAA